MLRGMKRITLLLTLVLVLCLNLGWTAAIDACPGCKEALANQDRESEGDDTDAEALPWNPAHAYSYSVLFMLAVPALLLTGFGIAFYRLSRKAAAPDVLPPMFDERR